jgi:hypothetical protein
MTFALMKLFFYKTMNSYGLHLYAGILFHVGCSLISDSIVQSLFLHSCNTLIKKPHSLNKKSCESIFLLLQ